MKEFDMNNNTENENTNNENTANESFNTEPTTEIPANNTVNPDTAPEPEKAPAQESQVNTSEHNAASDKAHTTENPYFKGFGSYNYGEPQNRTPQYGTGTNQQNPQNPQPQNSQYSQYNNSGYNYNSPANDMNRGNTGYNNYNYRQYDAPTQSRGQISYTPNPKKAKKEKKSGGISKGAVAGILVSAVILSCGAGFGGAMLANNLTSKGEQQQVNTSGPISTIKNPDDVVIYRSIDEVATSTGTNSEGNYSYAQVAAMVKDSVVEITTEYNTTISGWYNYVQQGAGSGVIISKDGYIITNAHVIVNESTGAAADAVKVRLTNGTEYDATVIGYDTDEDIAIIKVEAENLTAAQCGDSSKLSVGEELIIVGNPLGELGGTVTNGIVSATERELEVNGVKMNLIQTNAAVNPGNSGGGMFNMKGQLVGIVNAKSSGTAIEGLGFAIPVNQALSVSEQLLQYGYVRGKTMIGVTFTDVSSNNFFYSYNIKAGVYVDSCTEGYNDQVLKSGDRVVAVNGETVNTTSDIKAIVTSSAVGDKLKFQIERNGKLMEVEVECFEKVPTKESEKDIEFNNDQNASPYGDNSGSYNGSFEDFFGSFFN